MANQTNGNGAAAFLSALPSSLLEGSQGFAAASQAMAERWIANRTEQVRFNVEACTKLASCKSPSEFAELQQRWWQTTVDQLTAEMKGFQEQISALSAPRSHR